METGNLRCNSPERRLKVVVVRDRASAGGGIHAYYQALRPHFTVTCEFVDVGQPYIAYESSDGAGTWQKFTILRLLRDWCALLLKLLEFPDLVHINPGLDSRTRRSLRRDAVNIAVAKLFRRPVLIFWRGWDSEACQTSEFPGGRDSLCCRIYRLADAHIVLASDFKETLLRWNFRGPVYVETTVVPDEVMEGAPESRALNLAAINLLFLSRIEVAKGIFELLEAFRLLQSRRPNAYTLTFAGDGSSLKELQERVVALGVRDVFFPGFVAGDKKVECYLNASIFCFLSSHGEGMPNAVLEAMAMGLPLVSSNAGGLKDILRDGETGYIVSPVKDAPPGTRFSPEEVANHIERMVQSSELYRRISVHNRNYARDRFAAARVAQRLEAIYRSVLERTGPAVDPWRIR